MDSFRNLMELKKEPELSEIGMDEITNEISKRFYAACAAISGLIIAHPGGFDTISRNVKDAFEYADELLKQENQ